MLFSEASVDATTVRVTINPPMHCNGWAVSFGKAGWRSFYRDIVSDGSVLYWLLKRGSSAFLIAQRADASQTVELSLPREDAAEICHLMVVTGLGVPAP